MIAEPLNPREERNSSCCSISADEQGETRLEDARSCRSNASACSPSFHSDNVGKTSRLSRCLLLVTFISLQASHGFVVRQVTFVRQPSSTYLTCRQPSKLWATETELPTDVITSDSPIPLVSFKPDPGVSIASASENTIVILNSNNEEDKSDTESIAEKEEEPDVEDTPSQEDDKENDEATMERRRAAATSALFRHNKSTRKSGKKLKDTSIGPRRVGSATKARNKGASTTSQLLGTVRSAAATAASSQSKDNNTTSTASDGNKTPSTKNRSSPGMSETVIQSTINDILKNQDSTKTNVDKDESGTTLTNTNMGVLGERQIGPNQLVQKPFPGTVLLRPSDPCSKTTKEAMSVRLATPSDDVDIANLRLSVFSDFSRDVQKHFCYRSCQVLASRRLRGATCLVATVPRQNSEQLERTEHVLGSVECSVHEFHGTQLGQSRPEGAILYITEVAVSPRSRRCGIGTKLLQGVDEFSALRNVETLYLHVDVKNVAALTLYEKAGYHPVDNRDPLFDEFTTSLNLHDGATKGRNHFLLYKHLTSNPTWIPLQGSSLYGVNTLGFDIMA